MPTVVHFGVGGYYPWGLVPKEMLPGASLFMDNMMLDKMGIRRMGVQNLTIMITNLLEKFNGKTCWFNTRKSVGQEKLCLEQDIIFSVKGS